MAMSSNTLDDLSPAEVARALEANEILLVDVREAHEYGTERIPGALLMPLSTFDPHALPVDSPRRVVLHCAAGKRSAMAAEMAQQAGIAVNAHMGEGMMGWKQAGLAVLQIQPSTGQMVRSKS